MNRRIVISLFLALVWVSFSVSVGGSESTIVTPEGDLPRARVKDFEVAFTRNGAFVVSRNGQNLFDCGLLYATPEWAEWGTQIRRSARRDGWNLKGEEVKELVTRGTLFSVKQTELLKFTQRVIPIPGGLRFTFEITPLSARQVQYLGLVLHFPVVRTSAAEVAFWPGFRAVTLPKECQQAVLHYGTGRGAVLRVLGKSVVSIVGPAGAVWNIFDDRTWKLNTFRLIANDAALLKDFSAGKKVLFSFDILLGGSDSGAVPLGAGECCVDPYGRLSIRTAGVKLLEGGVSSPGASVLWFAEQTQPVATLVQPADGKTRKASGRAIFAGTTVEYDIATRAETGSALVTYQLRPQADKPFTGEVSLTFALPETLAAGAPKTTAPPESLPGSTPATPADKPSMHVVTVDCSKGLTLKLTADRLWTVSKGLVNEQPCFLLTTPLTKSQDGRLEGQVQFSMSKTETKPEKGP